MTESSRSRRYLALILIGILLLPGVSLCQLTFERAYGGMEHDDAFCIQQTKDDQYIVVGTTASFGAGAKDVYLLKIDFLGGLVWERALGGSIDDVGRWVVETPGGGYAISGWREAIGTVRSDVLLMVTDSLRTLLHERTCGGADDDYGYSLDLWSGGGYVIGGFTESYGPNLYLVWTDSLGDSLRARSYGTMHLDFGGYVSSTYDGGCIVVGTSHHEEGMEDILNVYAVKLDSLTDTVWSRTYGEDCRQDMGQGVAQCADSSYAIVATSGGPGGAWLIKADVTGDTLWTGTYGLNNTPYAVQQTLDRGYVIAGFDNTNWLSYLTRVDSLGNPLWMKTYGYYFALATSIRETSDGGYVLAGSIYDAGVNTSNVYVVKTDGNGVVHRDAGVVSIDAPLPDTVFTDSTYPVIATLHNYRPAFVVCWVEATVGEYISAVHTGLLGPDSSMQVTFADWHVPPDDSIVYTLTICALQEDDVDPTNDCAQKSIFVHDPVGIENQSIKTARALHFEMRDNEPNPFRSSTLISYCLPATAQVTLSIYDIIGRLVETLVDETQQSGIHQVRWNRKDNPSGVYFYSLRAGGSRRRERWWWWSDGFRNREWQVPYLHPTCRPAL